MDILIAAIIGLCLGSFATVLLYRIPRKEQWTKGRSRCPSCETVLSPRDLVPVLSWAVHKGRCSHCGARIPAFYPLAEILTAGAAILVYLGFKAFSG